MIQTLQVIENVIYTIAFLYAVGVTAVVILNLIRE